MISNPDTQSPQPLFRICRRKEWEAAKESAVFLGSEIDKRDGFLHLSSASQVLGTLQTHFRGVPDLVVLRIDPSRFGDSLRWEPSRGGELFPHLYGPLPGSAVLAVTPVPEGSTESLRSFLES